MRKTVTMRLKRIGLCKRDFAMLPSFQRLQHHAPQQLLNYLLRGASKWNTARAPIAETSDSKRTATQQKNTILRAALLPHKEFDA
jgi:hypothetical protein